MSITLSDGTTTINIHPDSFWSDEYAWNPVVQTEDYSITGALILMAAAKQAGRPITLEPEDDSACWTYQSVVAQLRNWAAVPGKQMTLTLRGVDRTVVFRHQDGGFEARPVVQYNDVVSEDFYLCTVRLQEI